MSGIKRLMEQQEEQRWEARAIARKAKVLTACEYHGETFATGKDIVEAYKLAATTFKNADSSSPLKTLFQSQKELTDCIKEEVEDAAEECWACAKIRDE